MITELLQIRNALQQDDKNVFIRKIAKKKRIVEKLRNSNEKTEVQ